MLFFSAFPFLFILMHSFFNICMFVALSQTRKVKAVKCLHWREGFYTFRTQTLIPSELTPEILKKFYLSSNGEVVKHEYILLILQWSRWNIYSTSYLGTIPVRKTWIFLPVIYLKYEIHDLGNALFFYSEGPVEFSACSYLFLVFCCCFFGFWFLNASVLLTLSVRGKLCCNWERQKVIEKTEIGR